MEFSIWLWVAFNLLVVMLLFLDMGVFHRGEKTISLREGAVWSAVWMSLALAFNLFLLLWRGDRIGLEFLTAYVIEKSLSMDNIFVFVLIFDFFKVPGDLQHRVLFWGVLGAIVMRGILIVIGVALVSKFEWVFYVFGVFLVIAGIRIASKRGSERIEPQRNPIVRLFRRYLPITEHYQGKEFVVRLDGKSCATPLLMVLLLIESMDLVFALDSIPAVLSITQDAFIVYSSNVFAVLGLRALYFVLRGIIRKFTYLQLGLGLVLAFAGAKMLLREIHEISILASLLTIAGILSTAVIASLLWGDRFQRHRWV